MKKIFLILVAVICFGINVSAQEKHDSKFQLCVNVNAHEECESKFQLCMNVNVHAERESKFLLLIENTENGINITSTQGCAFKELSFSLKENQIQEIDQFGMRYANDKVRKDDNLASFRINIKKTKEGLAFEGIEGTTWKKLSFTCPINEKRLIDQNGMKEMLNGQ